MNKKYSLEGILKLCGGNPKFMNEFITLFIDTTPVYMNEATEACQAGNWKKVAEVLHKIKPTVEMFAMDISASLGETEQSARNEEGTVGLSKSLDHLNKYLEDAIEQLRAELKNYPAG
jgi:HPt (histidine-containing phosphotransfer) domain-containing protein